MSSKHTIRVRRAIIQIYSSVVTRNTDTMPGPFLGTACEPGPTKPHLYKSPQLLFSQTIFTPTTSCDLPCLSKGPLQLPSPSIKSVWLWLPSPTGAPPFSPDGRDFLPSSTAAASFHPQWPRLASPLTTSPSLSDGSRGVGRATPTSLVTQHNPTQRQRMC